MANIYTRAEVVLGEGFAPEARFVPITPEQLGWIEETAQDARDLATGRPYPAASAVLKALNVALNALGLELVGVPEDCYHCGRSEVAFLVGSGGFCHRGSCAEAAKRWGRDSGNPVLAL